jgi:hypothetical protein
MRSEPSGFRRAHRIASMLVALVLAAAAVAIAAPAGASPRADAALQASIDTHLRLAGGTQITRNQIAWNGGTVIMTFPEPASASTTAARAPRCPGGGWACFFEHRDWGGRMLQFQSCGYYQYFSDYGFDNQTSSWHNRQAFRSVDVYDWVDGGLWHMEQGNVSSSYVGNQRNDKADYFMINC